MLPFQLLLCQHLAKHYSTNFFDLPTHLSIRAALGLRDIIFPHGYHLINHLSLRRPVFFGRQTLVLTPSPLFTGLP